MSIKRALAAARERGRFFGAAAISRLGGCAILLAACGSPASPIRGPVGYTDAAPTLVPQTSLSRDAGGPNNIDAHVEGKSDGPCDGELPIIGFSGASTAISDLQTQALQRLAICMNAAPYEKMSLVLVGYTDVIGTMAGNLELGLARAQGVMRQLMNDGVAPGRIVVASAGELQRPSARWGLHAHRVEILLARGGPSRPNEAPIARGIDVEGMLPRRPAVSSGAAAAAMAAARGSPAAGSPPIPRRR